MQPSAELVKAQARLLQLRATFGIEVKATPQPVAASQAQPVNWLQLNAQSELQRRREQAGIRTTTAAARAPAITAGRGEAAPPLGEIPQDLPAKHQILVVHPTLLLALLKNHLEAPGRVYLLLRVLDRQGQGWLHVTDIRRELTGKASPLKICGWRRLRQLLHQGEGVFWYRDDQDRLWLKGMHRIAYTLDLTRAQGFPIELPIQALLGGIQAVRAAFYACFHSGRSSKPISRETLYDLSGIAERTQRIYDHQASVTRRCNLAIGERYTTENAQQRAWKQGRGVFHFVDTNGHQGPKNKEYIAWQLPNSYEATYQRRSRGSRKRLNRKLKDLLTKGITGNAEAAVERVFFGNGALAAKAYNRDPEHDAYWEGKPPTCKRAQFWQVISGIQR